MFIGISRLIPRLTCKIHTPEYLRNIWLTSRRGDTRVSFCNHVYKQKHGQIMVIVTRHLYLSQKQNLSLRQHISSGLNHSVVGQSPLWYSNVTANTRLSSKFKLSKLLLTLIVAVTGIVYCFKVHSKPVLAAGDTNKVNFTGADIENHSAGGDYSNINFIADVVDQVSPAVVFVEIKKEPKDGYSQNKKSVTISNGSGFVARNNGIILTNAHVVANVDKTKVEVTLQDGRVFEGRVIAVDPICDLAAIKIDADELKTIELGKSSELRSGEWVIALGSPLSLTKTVTCGIVSNVQRKSGDIGLPNKNMDYIQTDAIINFGNSGGPLVDMDGYCVGVNSMKLGAGISFAIPSAYARTFLHKAEALMRNGQTENGFTKRRYMGVTMLTLTKNLLEEKLGSIGNDINRDATATKETNGVDLGGGVFVMFVIPGTPAQQAGILPQDIIIEINGQTVLSAADVYDIVGKSDNLSVKILRNGQAKTFQLNTLEAF